MLAKFRDFDFYRRIPKDLTETTSHGSWLSLFATLFMLSLFVAELWAYLSYQTVTSVIIDPNKDSLLRINFNITVMDISCEFATLDVVDVLGTRKDNITRNINKWQVDSNGVRRNYEGRNMEQKDLLHDMHHDIDALMSNGVHAVSMTEDMFESWVESHQYTFINFYAPWCVWCQRLEPVWEAFAEKVEEEDLPVSIVRVDCIANRDLCIKLRIQAFPALRLFKDSTAQTPDYRNDRTLDSMMEYLTQKIATDEKVASMIPSAQAEHKERVELTRDDHPGCMMSGFLLVNRVPGNFHIESRSRHHTLNPSSANVSHTVNHLSFGPVLSRSAVRKVSEVPDELFELKSTETMDGNAYLSKKLHQAYHHYIKIISTQLEVNNRFAGKDAILVYQMVQSSQAMQYTDEEVPEARFTYDLSPMAVQIKKKGKHWYEFITSMCALIGGTFTVMGLLSAMMNGLQKQKKAQ